MTSPTNTNRLSILLSIFLSACFFLLLLMACNKKEITEKPSNNFAKKSSTNNLERQFELDIKHYVNSYNNAYWDEVIETMYPPLFGGKTKDDMITTFIQSSLMGIDRQTEILKFEKITPVVEANGNRYAKIYYGANVQVNLSEDALKNKEYIKYNLELSYDTDDVLYNENNEALTINNAYCSMFAVSKKGSNIWKYIEVDQQKASFLSKVIPQKILDTLNNY